MGVRPEDLRLHHEEQDFALPVRMQRMEFLGAEALAHLSMEGHDKLLIARLAPQQAAAFHAGEQLFATPRQDRILAFGAGGGRVACGIVATATGRNAA